MKFVQINLLTCNLYILLCLSLFSLYFLTIFTILINIQIKGGSIKKLGIKEEPYFFLFIKFLIDLCEYITYTIKLTHKNILQNFVKLRKV